MSRPTIAPVSVAKSDPRAEARAGVRLGRVAGVPVYLNASWFVLAVVLVVWYGPVARQSVPGLSDLAAYAVAGVFAVFLLLSVLLHELGHALTARWYGIGVRAITLELLGGYTEMSDDSPSARSDLWVSLAGPAVSAGLGGLGLGLVAVLPAGGLSHQLAFQLAASNIIVAIFNVLPGLPLDGGRALRAVVWALSGDRHLGSRVAGWIGRVVAVGCVAVAVYFSAVGDVSFFSVVFMLLVALTLWQGATAAIRYGRLAARLPRVDLRELARPLFAVPAGLPLAEALRQAAQAGAGGAALGVVDGAGRLLSIVNEQAAEAVPAERRPWVPVESVARTLDPGRTLAADLAGEDVIRAMHANPASDYLVVAGERVVGVLRSADLARVLDS